MSKVILFVKSIDVLDYEKFGLLLATYEMLTTDWAVVKRVCGHFDKRHDWNNPESSTSGAGAKRKLEEPVPTRAEETRRWLKSGTGTCQRYEKGPGGKYRSR